MDIAEVAKSSKVVTCYFKWHFLIYMKKNCYDNGVSKIPNDISERGMLQGVFLDLHMTHLSQFFQTSEFHKLDFIKTRRIKHVHDP